MLFHIGAFHLDLNSRQTTPWHTLTPQTRLLCALLAVLAITLTPNGQWLTWGVYGVALLGLVMVSRVNLPVLLQRLAVEMLFVGAVVLGTLFRREGEVVWRWGVLQVTDFGLIVLGSVTCKLLLSLLMLNLLTLTTSIPALLNGLLILRTPPLLVAILESMYRYIGVLIGELNALKIAAASRNFGGKAAWKRQAIANMLGSLFIRTYERGERVHQAMLARGYQGIPPMETLRRGGKRDMLALTVTGAIAILGQAVG